MALHHEALFWPIWTGKKSKPFKTLQYALLPVPFKTSQVSYQSSTKQNVLLEYYSIEFLSQNFPPQTTGQSDWRIPSSCPKPTQNILHYGLILPTANTQKFINITPFHSNHIDVEDYSWYFLLATELPIQSKCKCKYYCRTTNSSAPFNI